MTDRFLVTGGRGRLARALVTAGGSSVRALSHADLDIQDGEAIARCLDTLCATAVINAAVVNGVDRIEKAPDLAFGANVMGPAILAAACATAAIPLIHISTDYVFGAPTERPWRESDPVSPVNAYGRQKAEAEQRVLAAHPSACIVRVAWLFGDDSCFVAKMLETAGQVEELAVAADQTGAPTPLQDLAPCLLSLAARMAAGEPGIPRLLHLAGTPPVVRADWIELALDALAKAGCPRPRLRRVSQDAFPAAARRPHLSALDCGLAATRFGWRLDWREATLAAARRYATGASGLGLKRNLP